MATADSTIFSLLQNLKVDDPWTSPRTWDSISSESGSGASPSSDSAHNSTDPTIDPSSISEANLVRLVMNALQGVKSALALIEKLSVAFCSSPADRNFHRVPNLWCRSSSTSVLGKMLKYISYSGCLFLNLRQFVDYYQRPSMNLTGKDGEKQSGTGKLKDYVPMSSLPPLSENVHHKEKLNMQPPFSLVNQSFAVAVGKVLEGYLSALNTLITSVRLRRSLKHAEAPESVNTDESILASVVHSEITFLEVYLHTEELRTHIDVLGNICFPQVVDYNSLKERLTTVTSLEFHNFPRGPDLLTYLYVLLRNADPGHHSLLKFLFVQAWEPYYGFIKSWIYRASIDDPYEEFFVVDSDISSTSKNSSVSTDNMFLASSKWRDLGSVPCFVKDTRQPILRAGQQLDVLVKLLNLCSSMLVDDHLPCNLAYVKDILPCWVDAPRKSAGLLNPLTFSKEGIESLIRSREAMYKSLMERLQLFFTKLDGKYQRMAQTVLPPGIAGFPGNRSMNVQLPYVSDWDLDFSSTFDIAAIHEDAGLKEDDASSTSDASSFGVEPSQFSESSSFSSDEEKIDPEGTSELNNTSYQQSENILSHLLQRYPSKYMLLKSENEDPNSIDYSHADCDTDGVIPFGYQCHDDVTLSQKYASFRSSITEFRKSSETSDEGFQFGKCWPLGGILENPFYADLKYNDPKQLGYIDCSMEKAAAEKQSLEKEVSKFDGTLFQCGIDISVVRKNHVVNNQKGNISTRAHRSWNSYELYDLNINPILTKTDWLRTVRDLREKGSMRNGGPCFRNFDFSSVHDPFMANLDNVIASNDKGSQDASTVVASNVNVLGMDANPGGGVKDMSSRKQSVLSSVCSPRAINLQPEVLSKMSGGAGWEALLNYSGADIPFCTKSTLCDFIETFEIPLDVIIDKCMKQEILTQYKYVSNFTIKLLEDGFDLREHLLALRRYYFMELADWTDSFIVSIRNQKWSLVETDNNIIKIQGLLDLALQRSACERDPYRKRLFFYSRGRDITPEQTSAIGLHTFQSMILGYRVNWPVSLVVTQEALKIYGDIFNYLIQIRLAVSSLTDIWQCLKAIVHSSHHGSRMGSESDGRKVIATLTKLRQQINHFVATLQQYVHSQLSDESWCQFQHSLKHQVKDILDLESVHMSYLADALHICFLSAETKPTANIIKNILQCAMEFHLCFPSDFLLDGDVPIDLCSQIHFSKVFAVKNKFEQNLKDLYVLYLKSPKHGRFSLCRFWAHLNYNDYFAATISKDMSYLYR